MARRDATARADFGKIHPRHRTPDVSTWWVAGIAIAWYVGIYQVSENALFDSLTALALLIAFYYALTGIACAVYYRKHLTESAKNLLLIGVGPLVGSGLLIWLLVLSVRDMSDPANSYSGQSWLGVGPPLVIGIGIFVVGLVFMLVWRTQDKRYWDEKPGLPDPDVVRGVKSASPRSRRTGRLGRMAVVLGYDESPGADAALEAAIEVASRYGEELVLVYGAAPPGGLGEEFKSHRDALMEMGRTATAHALEKRRGRRSHGARASSSTPSLPRR